MWGRVWRTNLVENPGELLEISRREHWGWKQPWNEELAEEAAGTDSVWNPSPDKNELSSSRTRLRLHDCRVCQDRPNHQITAWEKKRIVMYRNLIRPADHTKIIEDDVHN